MNVTKDVLYALQRDVYPPPKWMLSTEVQVPYADGKRFLDAVAVDLWAEPHETIGIEAKCSRGDWLSEARKPEKSKPGRDATDRFVYVFGSPHIYQLEEVPVECGVIHVDANGHCIQVRPAKRKADADTEHYRRGLLVAFLTRYVANRHQHGQFLDRLQREAQERGYRMGYNAAKRTDPVVAGKARHSNHANPDKSVNVKVDGDGFFCP